MNARAEGGGGPGQSCRNRLDRPDRTNPKPEEEEPQGRPQIGRELFER